MTESPRPIPPAMLDRAGRVALDLACRKCGRNLRGMLPEGPCPECGMSVAHALSETLDAEGRVQSDVACLKCGYNLRSLTLGGKCPECGSPVADSVRGDLLEFADPAWVSGLAAGATRLLASGIGAVAAIACGLLGALLFDSDSAGILSLIGAVARAVACIGAILALLSALGGLVSLTAREPHPGFRPEGLSARRACHYSLVAIIPLVGLCVGVGVILGRMTPRWAGVSLGALTLVMLLGALPVSLLRHLAALFRRVPNTGHAKMACWLSNAILVIDGILAFVFLASLITSPMGDLECAALIGLLLLAACGLGLFDVLYHARADFAKAGELAKARAGIAAVDQAAGDHRED